MSLEDRQQQMEERLALKSVKPQITDSIEDTIVDPGTGNRDGVDEDYPAGDPDTFHGPQVIAGTGTGGVREPEVDTTS